MKNLRLKETKLDYYDEFINNADIAVKISEMLKEFIDNFDSHKSKEVENKVHKLENEADQNLHRILNFLISDFLPPIDREDIVLLVNRIDDTIDCIDEIVINLDIYNILELREDLNEYIELINKICLMQKDMMERFKNIKKHEEVQKLVIDINNTEEQADKIYEKSIKDLYQNGKDPIEIMKWNTIYNSIENCFDSFESVANTVGEIVLKNL